MQPKVWLAASGQVQRAQNLNSRLEVHVPLRQWQVEGAEWRRCAACTVWQTWLFP